MGRIERTLASLAAVLTIATGGFLVYDRFLSDNAASKPEAEGQVAAAGTAAAPAISPAPDAGPAATPAGGDPAITSNAAPKAAADEPKPKAQLVFLCDGQQSATFEPGRNPNPALERFRHVPPTAEAIFDFSDSKQSGTGEALVHSQGSEWSAYLVAVQLAGGRSLYGATGKNAQSNGVTFLERGEVNLETLEWTSTRVIRAAAPRGPQAEIRITGKCAALESKKPTPSDAPPQWEVEAKLVAMPR